MDNRQRNAADPNQVKEASRKERDAARMESEDLVWIMHQEPGRRFMTRLLDFLGVRRTAMDHSGAWSNFKMGAQNAGFALLEQLEEHCPEQELLRNRERLKQNNKENANA